MPTGGNTPGGIAMQVPGGSITGVQEELESKTYSDRCWVSSVCLSHQYLGCPDVPKVVHQLPAGALGLAMGNQLSPYYQACR